MKNIQKITTVLAAGALSFAALTGCGNTGTSQAEETAAPVSTSTEASPSAEQPYLENSASPFITEADLNDPIREGIQEARKNDAPLFVYVDQVYWLKADVPYAERQLVEEEARKAANEHPIRWVDGLGTGTLTFYRYDDPQPYTIKVEQPSASASETQG